MVQVRVGWGQLFVARVGSAIHGLGLENFRKKVKFFNFFLFGSKKYLHVRSESTQVKGGLASYLLRVKSKLEPGQGPSLLLPYLVKFNPLVLVFLKRSLWLRSHWHPTENQDLWL